MEGCEKEMIATHVVKDSSKKIVGFIVDEVFYADYRIKENIELVENLKVNENNMITTDSKLLEVDYKTALNKTKYERLVAENPFEREIQDEFKKWKNDKQHKVLQLEGARQIGKTTELLKFAYKNYEYVIVVDLSNDIYRFDDVVLNGCDSIEMEKYCRRAQLPHFVNSRNTIIVIDEIQNDSRIYNSIRKLNMELDCDIIVTGSYLGRIVGNRDFFLPAGTVAYSYMYTLSFMEFCKVFECEELLKKIDLYGTDDKQDYERLEQLYRIYIQIGGYPEVVKTFQKTGDVNICYEVIEKLLHTFKEESRVYFKESREVEIFENVYREALKEMCNHQSAGGKHVLENITSLVKESTKLMINRDEIAKAVVWLKYAGILSMCNLAVDGDMRNIAESRKAYFSDCGIVSYLASRSLLANSSLVGIITETFVYNELHRLFKVPYSELKVLEEEVCYSVYGNYELDFMIADKNKVIYGIEVKTKEGIPKSLKIYLDKKLVDKGILAKPSVGGRGEIYDTIPIYTVGCRFPYN